MYSYRAHSVTPDILLVVNEFWSYSGMSAVARAVKRKQKRDFMIAMTKFCGLFGVLEICVSWVWDGMVQFIFYDDDDDHHHHRHHFLSRMRLSVSNLFISCSVVPDYCFPLADILILVPAKCCLPFFAYNY